MRQCGGFRGYGAGYAAPAGHSINHLVGKLSMSTYIRWVNYLENCVVSGSFGCFGDPSFISNYKKISIHRAPWGSPRIELDLWGAFGGKRPPRGETYINLVAELLVGFNYKVVDNRYIQIDPTNAALTTLWVLRLFRSAPQAIRAWESFWYFYDHGFDLVDSLILSCTKEPVSGDLVRNQGYEPCPYQHYIVGMELPNPEEIKGQLDILSAGVSFESLFNTNSYVEIMTFMNIPKQLTWRQVEKCSVARLSVITSILDLYKYFNCLEEPC